MKQPKLIDHENKIVFYNEEDITDEIMEYWANTAPYYPTAKYENKEHEAIVTDINIKRALRIDAEKAKEDKDKSKDDKIADLEARLNKLEKK